MNTHYNSNNNKQTQDSRFYIIIDKSKKMDIESDPHTLTTLFHNLIISPTSNKQSKRISNTLIAKQMQSQLNPNHIDQYNVLYLNRLKILRSRFDFKKIHQIQEVQEILGVVHVVGIFKRVQAKRVRAFQKGFDEYYKGIQRVYDERDGLEIQDASGKLKFTLTSSTTLNNQPIKPTDLPYGIIIGLTGKNNDQKMQFMVDKITLPNLAPQKSIKLQYKQKTGENGRIKKTLFMSATTIQQLDYVLGQLVKEDYQMCFQEDVHAVVVMGFRDKLNAADYKRLDEILLYFGKLIDIHIMPNDKLGEIYPQKPLHPILFPNSYKKISLVNNPQIFHTNPNPPQVIPSQTSILVCSGQNIKDLRKNSSYGQNSLDSMQQLLKYSHIAPTCPFSLKCQMMDQDHLIINEMPHVFIAGNCDQDTMFREWEEFGRKVLLVAIGKGQSILLDENLHAVRIDFVGAGASSL